MLEYFALILLLISNVENSEEAECLIGVAGEDYVGLKNQTVTGAACLPWTSQYTCSKSISDVNSTSPHSFCRNPSEPADCHRASPWCYISSSQWQYCDIPPCGVESSSCNSELGMGSGLIKDTQISASSFYWSGREPYYARINITNTNFWTPNNPISYISINLTTPFKITKLYIQGDSNYYVKTFKVIYSMDGFDWTTYSEDGVSQTYLTADSGPQIRSVYFKKPFEAIHFAILPKTFQNFPGLKLELFGCPSFVTLPSFTDISQNIETKVLWSYGGSPYIVRSLVTILPSASLTIDPKVKIIFSGKEAGLKIQGCLISNGKRGLEVEFKSTNLLSEDIPQNQLDSDFWAGLTFEALQPECHSLNLVGIRMIGGGLKILAGQVSLESVQVSHTKVGLFLPNINPPSNITISNSMFVNNQNAMSIKMAQIVMINNTKFSDNQFAVNINSDNTKIAAARFTIESSTFAKNIYAIYFQSYCSYSSLFVTINNSQITDCSEYGFYLYRICNSNISLAVDNSIFRASRIQTYLSSNSPSIISLTNSRFENGSASYYLVSINWFISKVTVSNSSFSYSKHGSLRLQADGEYLDVEISNCLFQKNKNSLANLMEFRYDNNNNNNMINGIVTIITNNIFLENEMLTSVSIYDNSKVKRKYSIKKNAFLNNLIKTEIYVDKAWLSDYFLDFSNNYWNSTEKEVVLSKINAFHSSLRRIAITIDTIYTDQNMSSLVNTSNWNLFVLENNEEEKHFLIGGRILSGVVIVDERELLVLQSIHVARDATLIINSPANIRFVENTGILIEGQLILSGNAGEITMSANSTAWEGLIFYNRNDSVLNNLRLNKTKEITIEIINSSITINNSIINLSKKILATGLETGEISILNSEIIGVSSDVAILIKEVDEVKIVIKNSVIRKGYTGINFVNCERIMVDVDESKFLAQDSMSLRFDGSSAGGELVIYDSIIEKSISIYYFQLNVSISNSELGLSSESNCLYYFSLQGYSTVIASIYNSTFKCKQAFSNSYFYQKIRFSFKKNNFISSNIDSIINKGSLFIFSENIMTMNFMTTKPISLNLYGNNANDMYSFNDNVLIENNQFVNINISSNQDLLSSVINIRCYNGYTASIGIISNEFRNIIANNVISNDCAGLYLSKNKFYNPHSSYDLRLIVPNDGQMPPDIYAIGNYWGSSSVESRIFDKQDDNKLPSIIYSPYYSDANFNLLKVSETNFIKPNSLDIGGRINHDTTLINKGGSYNVVSDIIIPFGKKLVIEKNVELLFTQGGITVQGSLIVNGNVNEVVKMSSTNENTFWKGITFQQPLNNLVREHLNGWWEININNAWRPMLIQNEYFKVLTADVLCKQAGYLKSYHVETLNCDMLPLAEKIVIPFCNSSISSDFFTLQCTQSSIKSVQECDFYATATPNFYNNISCLSESQATFSTKIYAITSSDGKKLIYLDGYLIFTDADSKEDTFIFTSPCLDKTKNADCVSIMLLSKPGWYIRIFNNSAWLESEFSSRSSIEFAKTSSFLIQKDEFISSYYTIQYNKQYLANINNTLSLLEKVESSLEKSSVSFSFSQISTTSSRKKKKVPTATLR